MPRTPPPPRPPATDTARPVMTRAEVGPFLAAAGPAVFILEHQHDPACPGRHTGRGCSCVPTVLLRAEDGRLIAEVR